MHPERLELPTLRSEVDLGELVFGILDTVKNGFGTARKLAGLEGVRFHDLRHTHATRLVGAHIPLSSEAICKRPTAECNAGGDSEVFDSAPILLSGCLLGLASVLGLRFGPLP